ncbi:hypothetical protein [Jatrophihabitans endophyticus]|uniref:hypothetical protein n=1 Tax=Jatrophihabitans endophyticus TaxID=1206085 RepID=UPI0019DCFAF9|nr:hypothetical protein [Jatrophihabitans endophyticus]MBE7188695.1 hypothetical protein [Jatrophihabitans endophyticus]
MPFGSRAAKLDRILAEDLSWGPSQVVDPNAQIRVPVTAVAGPSAASLARSGALNVVRDVATGYIGYVSAPPTVAKNTGRTVVLDPVGLRHVDIPQGVARLAVVHLNFAVRWAELYRVVMELLHNPRMNMTQTRIVLVPHDPNGFRAAHPEMAPMNGAARVGPDAWMLSLGMAATPDQYVVSGMLAGLGRYAPGIFSGQIDSLTG